MSLVDILNLVKDCFLCCFYLYGYNRDFEDKVDILRGKKRELQAVYVKREEKDRDVRSPTESEWLEAVPEYTKENGNVDSLLQRAEEEKAKQCLGYCSMNCCSVYFVSKDLDKMTKDLEGLINEGKGFEKDDYRPPQPVVERQDTENIVDMLSRLNEVWRLVEDDSVRIICLYGVRGVGKTTLLYNLNNKFIGTGHNFDPVILVKASAGVINIETIQQVMRYRLAISNKVWDAKNEQGRAAEICRRLSRRRFALLLDDLREPIDLKTAGVPIQNGSKIVFTTIMEEACNTMGEQVKFKVDYLPWEDAWKLFRHTVTDDKLKDPDVRKHAEKVAGLCGGLPLALITIGSAVRSYTNPFEWEHAAFALSKYPAKFPGIGDKIFAPLKFSYDRLSSDTQPCFLFCSLFPKNQLIRKDVLVDLWIGEGLLSNSHNIAGARRQGRCVIESLKRACLLEEFEAYFGNFVKMHDMIRDLALWIASQDQNNKILAVKSEDELIREQESASWNTAVRVSLWSSSITSLAPTRVPLRCSPATPTPSSCPRLLTLLVRHAGITEVPEWFFQSMPALRVLEWSRNRHLTKLPLQNGELIKLRYLNLSDTGISQLPIEIKECSQLTILLLDGTRNLQAIPEGLLSELSALQVFSRVPTMLLVDILPNSDVSDSVSQELSIFGVSLSLLHELESLEHIQDVSVVLSTLDSVQKFQSSSKLQRCTRRLIIGRPGSSSESFMTMTNMLQDGRFKNLQDLFISNASVKYLTCLINIPRLRFVFANNCPLLEEIIANDQSGPPIIAKIFPNLRQLNFRALPKLKSICGSLMAFPSLESIYVSECPNLKKLPFNSQSGNKNTVLIGRKEWWNQLTWDDDATNVFIPKFIPFSPSTAIFDPTLRPSYTYEASVIWSALKWRISPMHHL